MGKNNEKEESEGFVNEGRGFAGVQNAVKEIKSQIEGGNGLGEKVLLVAATKMQSPEVINAAIEAGVDAVAENKVQEFREKQGLLLPCSQHFIGHLQTNKVKYLVGKISLFHSCDREELAEEIARLSLKKGISSNVLIQVNIGREESKGGYLPEEAYAAYKRLSAEQGLCVKGFMAMLPDTRDGTLLKSLARKMRELFDAARQESENIEYLSMGMSGDYKLCIEEGSNMIRLGSVIFGKRDYSGILSESR